MKTLRAFIVLTASLLLVLLPKKFASACGFYVYPGEYRFWLLQPDLTNQPDLTPFFFAASYLYKDDLDGEVETYEKQNTNEWYTEIKKQASEKDIDSLLHQTDPQYFFDNEKELRWHNSFLAYLSRPANRELYEYLVISKKTEQVAGNPDPWGESGYHQAIMEVINEADSLYRQTRSPFLKLRTAYQMLRLCSYNGLSEKMKRIYDARIVPVKSNSWIKTAAQYQVAIRAGRPEQDYLLSKVFDKGDYRRTSCLIKFDSKNVDTILQFARNGHERNVIKAMEVCNYSGRSLSRIKEIYRAEPAYKDLPFLLLREINKIEDWLLTTKVTDFSYPAVYEDESNDIYEHHGAAAENYKKDKIYAAEFYKFLLQLINEKKQKNIALIKLYTAHLAMLNSNMDESARLLSGIKKLSDLPANVQTQIAVNRFLLHLEQGFDQQTENEFMSIIKQSPEQLGVYDPDIMKDQLILYTSRKLIAKGLKTKGLLLMSQTHRALGELPIGDYKRIYQQLEEIATPVEYDGILNTISKKNKTPFEKFVCNRIQSPGEGYYFNEPVEYWDKNKLLDCKSGWYIRNHDLPAALAALQQIPDSFWQKKPYSTYIGGNPFYLNVYHARGSTGDDKRDLNKRQVIEQMIRVEKLAATNPSKAAACYFQLANAWYNMTWFGKNWLMVKQWWSMYEGYDNEALRRSAIFNKDYFGCSQAKEYYLKAMQLTKDKDLASLCWFMSGVCENNYRQYMWCIQDANHNWDDYKKTGNPYTSLLRKKGVSKKRSDELIHECALYLDFISKYNVKL